MPGGFPLWDFLLHRRPKGSPAPRRGRGKGNPLGMHHRLSREEVLADLKGSPNRGYGQASTNHPANRVDERRAPGTSTHPRDAMISRHATPGQSCARAYARPTEVITPVRRTPLSSSPTQVWIRSLGGRGQRPQDSHDCRETPDDHSGSFTQEGSD